MNKIYKIIWQKSLNTWIVVSENARGKIKSKNTLLNKTKSISQSNISPCKDFKYSDINKKISQLLIFVGLTTSTSIYAGVGITGGIDSTKKGYSHTTNTVISSKLCDAKGNKTKESLITGEGTQYSVAIGCQNIIDLSTADEHQEILNKRGDAQYVNYPTGDVALYPASTAIGWQNSITRGGGIALGTKNILRGTNYSVAIGLGNVSEDYFSVVLGIGNFTEKNSAIAIGVANKVSGVRSIAIGRQSYAIGDDSVAIGLVATANAKNSIALGAHSIASDPIGNAYITNLAPSDKNGVLSIGSPSSSRRIQHVADGAQDSDAINVRQLKAAQENLKGILGESASDENGKITLNNIGGTGKKTIDEAIKSISIKAISSEAMLNFESSNQGSGNVDSKSLLSQAMKAGDGLDIGLNSDEKNLKVEANRITDAKTGQSKTTLDFSLKRQLDLGIDGSMTIGNVIIQNGHLKVGRTELRDGAISGLTNVTLDTENFAKAGRAATEEQLKLMSERQSGTNQTMVAYTIKTDPKDSNKSIPNYDHIQFAGQKMEVTQNPVTQKIEVKGGTKLTNVASAGDYTDRINAGNAINASDLHNAIINVQNLGLSIGASSGEPVKIGLGKKLFFKGKDGNTDFKKSDAGQNIYTHMEPDGTIRFGLAQNLILGTKGSISVGNIQIQNNQIKGLSNTDWNPDNIQADRAVTEKQLQQAISAISNALREASDEEIKYDQFVDGTFNKDKVSFAGKEGTVLANVADGQIKEDSRDAINGAQLWNVERRVSNNQNSIDELKGQLNHGKSSIVQQMASNSDIVIAKESGGKKIDLSGKHGNRNLTGIERGKEENDAVNQAQLNESSQHMAKFLGAGADYDTQAQTYNAPQYKLAGKMHHDVGSALTTLNEVDQSLGQRITNLGREVDQALTTTNQKIDKIAKQTNAGIAAAMALEAAPHVAGKITYAAGTAYHGGESAIGVTLRKTSEKGNWSITGGVATASEGKPSVRIGVSGVFD